MLPAGLRDEKALGVSVAVYTILQLPEESLARLGNSPQPLSRMLCAFLASLGDDLAPWVCSGCRVESSVACQLLVPKSAAETYLFPGVLEG